MAKGFLDIHDDPALDGRGDVYRPLLDFDGVDRKYDTVDDDRPVHTAVARSESKLFGERAFLGRGTVDPSVESRNERRLAVHGCARVGVDVVYVAGGPHAIDANPATSFSRAGLEDSLADSVEAASRQ